MNQGKLEVVKQEMARVNVDILGNGELKWTGMGEFNADDHCIYYCGHSQQKTPKCSPWMQSQKQQNDLRFQGKPFNITGIQVYAMNSNAEEAEIGRFYRRPSRSNTQKRCPFHYRGLECKSRKSRNTWSNRNI